MTHFRGTLIALMLSAAAFASTFAHAAVDVAGVKFEDKARLGQTELALNGAGLRSKFIIKVYAAGLYLAEKRTAAADVLAQKGAKQIRIVTLRELSAEDFVDALVEGIKKNHTEAEIEPLKARIETFKATMLALKTAAKGAVIQIDWLPESGTRLVHNGEKRGEDIPGEDFYRALLKIWLGDKPAAQDLKEALLGK